MGQIDDIRKYYDKVNAGFDHTLTLYRTKRFQEMLGSLMDGKKAALDIGCASGVFTTMMLQRDIPFIVALDVSEEMVKVTKKRYDQEFPDKRVLYVQANAEYLPFRKGVFDVVMQMRVLEYLTDPDHAVKDLNWCMLDDATFASSLPSKIGLKMARPPQAFFNVMVRTLLRKKDKSTADNVYRRFFTLGEGKRMFSGQGLKTKTTGIDYLVLPKLDGFFLRQWGSRALEVVGRFTGPFQNLSTNLVLWHASDAVSKVPEEDMDVLACPFCKNDLSKKGNRLVSPCGLHFDFSGGIARLVEPVCAECGKPMVLSRHDDKMECSCKSCGKRVVERLR